MPANALQIPELACGRFDFKGGTDIDGKIRAFVQELGVAAPPPSPQINERLAAILAKLSESKQPTLLVFDTYEAAPQPQQDWVEKELLIRLIRAPWLRVVIARQRVPETGGAIWGPAAHPVLELQPPRPGEWFDFGKKASARPAAGGGGNRLPPCQEQGQPVVPRSGHLTWPWPTSSACCKTPKAIRPRWS